MVDIQTLEPLEQPVTLTFKGPNVSYIIDTYSDPIASMNIDNGLASFRIDSSIIPSKPNPVHFKIQAETEGYFTITKTVIIQNNKANQAVIKLISTDLTKNVPGTKGIKDRSTRTNKNGVLERRVDIRTPVIEDSETLVRIVCQ